MGDEVWSPSLGDRLRQALGGDRIEQAKLDFCDLQAQICWLADRLSEARILVGQKECMLCPRMSFAECSRCWRLKAAETVRRERHAKP